MHLFHLKAEPRQDEAGGMRTWLVVADSLFDAMVLVPNGNIVRAARVELGAASGPARLIGSVEPSREPRPGLRQHDQAPHLANQYRPSVAHQHRRSGWITRRRG